LAFGLSRDQPLHIPAPHAAFLESHQKVPTYMRNRRAVFLWTSALICNAWHNVFSMTAWHASGIAEMMINVGT